MKKHTRPAVRDNLKEESEIAGLVTMYESMKMTKSGMKARGRGLPGGAWAPFVDLHPCPIEVIAERLGSAGNKPCLISVFETKHEGTLMFSCKPSNPKRRNDRVCQTHTHTKQKDKQKRTHTHTKHTKTHTHTHMVLCCDSCQPTVQTSS